MKDSRKNLFIDELKTQINFALYSIEGINKFLNDFNNEQSSDLELEKFWYYAQNLIVYCGNISKILWGLNSQNKTRRQERKWLRNELKIDGNSPLEKRYLRNALEHIDEKLEQFTKEEQNIILNKNFGPVRGMISMSGQDFDISKQKNLRHYDQYSKTYYFYGEEANLEVLYSSVKELKKAISEYEAT